MFQINQAEQIVCKKIFSNCTQREFLVERIWSPAPEVANKFDFVDNIQESLELIDLWE